MSKCEVVGPSDLLEAVGVESGPNWLLYYPKRLKS